MSISLCVSVCVLARMSRTSFWSLPSVLHIHFAFIAIGEEIRQITNRDADKRTEQEWWVEL